MRTIPSLSLAAALLACLPAAAAPINAIYTVDASGLADILGSATPPTDPVRLVFSISFNPASGDQFNDSTGITLLSASVPVSGTLAFDYDSANDILTVGGSGLSTSITAGTNDVLAEIDGASRAQPSFGGLEYTTSRSTGIFLSLAGSVSVVPEPGSMLVLAGGLLGLAGLRGGRSAD